MTKHEAAVIMAYTGISIGSFLDFHEYAEKIMGRPVWTHEFGSPKITKELKEKSKPDFIKIHEHIS